MRCELNPLQRLSRLRCVTTGAKSIGFVYFVYKGREPAGPRAINEIAVYLGTIICCRVGNADMGRHRSDLMGLPLWERSAGSN